jgi:methyltransferase
MEIVARGPYRWVRHPNYAAVIVELAALPLLGGALGTALVASLLNAVALSRRIPDEERALAASPAWRAQMARKPRFVPTLH